MAALGVPVRDYKTAAAWIGEKAARLKLNGRIISRSPVSELEELEVLRLGVEGKAAGWRTLRALADHDQRLDTARLDDLISRPGTRQASWNTSASAPPASSPALADPAARTPAPQVSLASSLAGCQGVRRRERAPQRVGHGRSCRLTVSARGPWSGTGHRRLPRLATHVQRRQDQPGRAPRRLPWRLAQRPVPVTVRVHGRGSRRRGQRIERPRAFRAAAPVRYASPESTFNRVFRWCWRSSSAATVAPSSLQLFSNLARPSRSRYPVTSSKSTPAAARRSRTARLSS